MRSAKTFITVTITITIYGITITSKRQECTHVSNKVIHQPGVEHKRCDILSQLNDLTRSAISLSPNSTQIGLWLLRKYSSIELLFSSLHKSTMMVGDLLLLPILLFLLHLPMSFQLPKAFDHPLHRPQSFTYHRNDHPLSYLNPKEASLPSLPKELVVNPKHLEEFDHPVHTPHRHHHDPAVHEVTRTHPSHLRPGHPPEVCIHAKTIEENDCVMHCSRRRHRHTGRLMPKQS